MGHKDPIERKNYYHRLVEQRKNQYFKDKKCYMCGSTENLQIDHINPSTKNFTIQWTYSEKRLKEELSKCDTLCIECHKLKTLLMDRVLAKHGTPWSYNKGCRCDECRNSHTINMREKRKRRKERIGKDR